MSVNEDPFALERLARRSCAVCGSSRLVWATVAEEADRRSAAGEDAGAWLSELAGSVRSAFGPRLLGMAAWRCLDCGEVRVFSPFRDDTAAPPPDRNADK